MQRVRELVPLAATDGQPALYLCNYEQGGFAIIAGDRHMVPILAFAEHGSLPTKALLNPLSMNDGVLSWLETTRRIAADLRQYPDAQNTEPGALALWASLVDKPEQQAATNPALRLAPDPDPNPLPQPVPVTVQVGPLLQTLWNQGAPYNAELLFQEFNGQRCVTGCVATSIAQVMYYWKYPSSYQWSTMPLIAYSNQSVPELARLMHNAGDAVDMSYGVTESGAQQWKVGRAFRDKFGYGSADYHDYPNGSSGFNTATTPLWSSSSDDVVKTLTANRPVIFGGNDGQGTFLNTKWPTGNGHSWVGDGYIQTQYAGIGSYLQSFHMNWGWGGQYNGWFSFNNWAIYSNGTIIRNYQYCQDVVLDIHP